MINKMRFLIAGLVVAVCLSFLIVVEPTSSADRLLRATTYGPQAHHEAVALVKKHYGRVAASNDIIDLWTKHFDV